MFEGVGFDARSALRSVRRTPGFAAAAVLTLALGIGANSAIFTVIHGVLLKPLPFEKPDELVGVWHTAPGLDFSRVNQSAATYFTYREEGRVFQDSGLWNRSRVSVTGLDEPEQVDALRVTDGTLPLLGIRPARGRNFTAADDSPDSPETVILSHGYWQRRFGADPQVLGRTIVIDSTPKEIIGVLKPDFRFLHEDPAVLLPLRIDRSTVRFGDFSYQGVARLKPGADVEQANADVARMIPLGVEKFPGGLTLSMLEQARFGPKVYPFKQDAVGDVGNVLWILLGTVGLVLLIACANVANLFLVRAEGRRRELAVRTAMGADGRRLAREFLTESLVLGMLGGLVGLILAFGGIRLLLAIGPEGLPRLREITVDLNVVLFTFVISIAAGLLFGLIPALKFRRVNLLAALNEATRGGGEGRERLRLRNGLVVSQIALALVLLVGSGLVVRSFYAMTLVQPGFQRPKEVMTLRISVPPAEIEDQVQAARTHLLIADKLRELTGVKSVGMSSSITMDGWDSNDTFYLEDFSVPDGQLPPIRRFKFVSEDYFEAMGNPVLAGRAIIRADIDTRLPVVVITENLARELWGNAAAALGKRARQDPDSPWREIVGVVGNIHDDGVDEEAVPTVFWPMLMNSFWTNDIYTARSLVYAIRTARIDDTKLLEEIKAAVWSVNANLPLAQIRRLDKILERSMARTSFTLVMLAIAAVVALLLGVVGIYGVISYGVSQRTREIGVRMALGARQGDVSRLVLRHGLLLAAIGVLLGLLAAFGLTRLMATLLFGVNPVDPLTYCAVSVALAAIVLAASYIPARRAARVDPMEALRAE